MNNSFSSDPLASDLRVVFKKIEEIIGERFTTSIPVRENHGKDESYHEGFTPDAVAFVNTTEEVSQILEICYQYSIPVIPFGAGTSLEGHIAAINGGVTIDISNMNEIIQVNVEDLDCRIMAGVTRNQLNGYLRDQGLFFPIDPGANATLGGMVATRASGTTAVKYGTMKDNVLSLKVVLSDGRVIETSKRARKSSAGYDLTRLFVGSEGTLGIITEITVKLYGIPEKKSVASCVFPNIENAINSVIEVIQSGVSIARIEFADETQIDAINKFEGSSYEVLPTLWMEFHGSENMVKEQSELVQLIVEEYEGSSFKWTSKLEDYNKLWKARHNAAYAALALRPGCGIWATDVCVPISKLAKCILETKKQIQSSNIPAPIVGHVGDGNFHVCFVVDSKNLNEIKEVRKMNKDLILRAIEMDGTCTGEHGIGYGKVDYLIKEHGVAVDVMRSIKSSLDPRNIMNPGKIFRN